WRTGKAQRTGAGRHVLSPALLADRTRAARRLAERLERWQRERRRGGRCRGSSDPLPEGSWLNRLAGADQVARGFDAAQEVPEQDASWSPIVVEVVDDTLPARFAPVGARLQATVEPAD